MTEPNPLTADRSFPDMNIFITTPVLASEPPDLLRTDSTSRPSTYSPAWEFLDPAIMSPYDHLDVQRITWGKYRNCSSAGSLYPVIYDTSKIYKACQTWHLRHVSLRQHELIYCICSFIAQIYRYSYMYKNVRKVNSIQFNMSSEINT